MNNQNKDLQNIDEQTLQKANQIGEEKPNDNRNNNNKTKNVKKHRNLWIQALVISFVPIILVPLFELIKTHDFCIFFNSIFSNNDILFIGITMMITTIMDLTDDKNMSSDNTWVGWSISIMTIGAAMYGIIEYDSKASETTVDLIPLNIAYIIVIITICLIKYHQAEKRHAP